MSAASESQTDRKRSWEGALERRRWLLFGAVVAIALLSAVVAWWWPRYGPLTFDRAGWDATELKENDFSRHRMADHLISSKTLDARTKAEVIAILGEPPDHMNSKSDLTYMLGSTRTFFPFLADLLHIQLSDDGRVSKVTIFQD